MVDRDEKQNEIAELWLESDRKNTIVVGTGVGKSKIAMIILESLFESGDLDKNSKILLTIDNTHLRDENWEEDFKKWGLHHIWKQIQAECYQTTCKWKNTEWDLVIADEIDFSLTPVFKKLYTKNQLSMVLGMTGYVDPKKMELLDTIAPVITEYSTQDAQADGILNSTQLVFVEYDLSKNHKDFVVKYKDSNGQEKSFTQSENEAYAYIEDKCNILYGKISRLEIDPEVAFNTDPTKVKELSNLKYQYNKAIADRKDLLYKGIGSKVYTQTLISKVLENPNNKILIFSMWTEQADAISEHTYHGKNKKDNKNLSKLSNDEIRVLGVCKAVNRGINLVGVNNMIMESYDGSKTQFTQRHGRGMRLKPNQKMFLYIMLPYYYKKVQNPEDKNSKISVRRPTQMVKWAESMIADFEFINPIRIKL
jgi:superfamily II DNA or RNA helicase